MELLNKIIECNEEDVDSIIDQSIKEANENADKVEQLGFLNFNKSNNVFKGFIPLDARIKYASMNMEDYGMQTTDFFHEFAHFARKHNINNKASLIYNLEHFAISYFGFPGKNNRETIFNDIAWQTTETDEEYFEALSNNKLGDLKGKGAAECTEIGALVQQILSFYGIEVYYCMGCVDRDNKQEAHCFNIVKRKKDYALLDYSLPVTSYNSDGSIRAYYPFVGILTNEEFEDFITNGTIKAFNNYYMDVKNPVLTETQRMYVVGKYEINNEKESGKSI